MTKMTNALCYNGISKIFTGAFGIIRGLLYFTPSGSICQPGDDFLPRKPPTPCAQPGCRELCHERFCPRHAKEHAAHYERHQRDRNLKKHYDSPAWRRLRRAFLLRHPLCQSCEAHGKYTPALEVHHVVPLSQGGTDFEGNLQALCKVCHSQHHAAAGTRWKQ
jgi:5-methylcytosine-specific restriction protein A